MDRPPISPKKHFYGWVITGIVFVILAMAYGAQYSFGIFFPFLIDEFHWNRQSLAGAFSLYTFVYSTMAVFLGRWIDRFGPRVILMLGSVCLGLGIGFISQVNAPWQLYLIYGFLAALGMSAAYMTGSPTVVKWFVQKRGLALGIAQSGLGLGVALIPALTGALSLALGWRPACMILGALVFAVLFTSALFLIGHPEKIGLHPDGQSLPPSSQIQHPPEPPPDPEESWSVAEAFRTRSFWLLNVIFFCTWLLVFFPLVHLVIFAIDIGLSKESAFLSLTILGGCSTLGRLVMGYASDRIGPKPTLVLNFALQAFSWFWIMSTKTSWMLFLFSVVFGFSYGGVGTVYPAIVGDYFGRRQVASLIGAIMAIAGNAAAIGPILGGYIHDLTQSYQLTFWAGGLTNLLALFLIFFSTPPQKTAHRS